MRRIFLYLVLSVSLVQSFSQPANNICTNAQAVLSNGTCVSGTTVNASDTWNGTVGCQDGNNGSNHPDVWYMFSATGTQAQFNVTTAGGFTGNVELIVVQGTCSGGFTLIGSQCGPSPLNATVNGLQIGTTYYYTISNASNGNTGTFQSCVTATTPPPVPGQDCPTAAILCDNSPFGQGSSVAGAGSISGNNSSENLSALGCLLQDERQSKWFKFTVGCTGTIQFLIDPVTNLDDYDWAVYDITTSGCNLTPGGSAVGGATQVACNFAGCPGNTGIVASTAAACSYSDFYACAGNPNNCDAGDYAQFSTTPPTLTAGRVYALIIDNYSLTNSGFNFTWLGGTAKIGPTSDFTFTNPSCGVFNFTKTCPTSNSTFLWTFGDGTTSNSQNPTHNYAGNGTYTVVLEVTDALGCSKTSSATVTVDIPVATATPSSQSLCSGAATSIALSSTIAGSTFSWTVTQSGASGATGGNGSSIVQTLNATGASAGTVTYTITPSAGGCTGNPVVVPITVDPALVPLFNAIAPICSGSVAPVLPTTSTNGITGSWSPATVSNTTSATYTFTPAAGQCATTTTLSVTVNSSVTPTFTAVAPICSGSVAPVLPTTSTNGITGSWSPATVSNTTSATYTFTPTAGQCATTTTLSVTVNSSVTPTFTAVAPICSGSVAPVLPTTSTNGITGSWSPATVSNTTSATYTFTPTAGQCATTTTLSVTVNSSVTPTFTAIAPICSGSVAPVLPTTSTNGITGSWSPATVSNTTSATYTFTPTAGQCATTTTLSVTVNSSVTPTFTAVAPICSGSVAPVLPTTSTNGITGSWSPATVSNTASATYTFTPAAGQCATSTTLSVTVNSSVTPTFTAIAPICSGSVAPVLPTTSTNGITGSWSPATVSNTASATYTFTPAAGQCATTTTLSVTVNLSVTPTFTAIAPVCSGSVAPVLPTTSTNGVTGSWSPATVSNTASATYTFTPAAGQCATTTTLSVTVNSSVTPTFTAIAPICSGSVAPVLPTTSTNGITGSWSPATVSNTASATYTFTPAAGQCATSTTLSVTVNSSVTPTFTAIAPICSGSVAPVLPATSTNGITGSWSPATVSNTASATYTFTPAAGQCATTTTLSITVNSPVTPNFNPVGSLCQNAGAPVLPVTSINGITGSWNPAAINTTSTGTTTYTFTPDAGQCATTTTLDVTVANQVTPVFTAIGPLCQNAAAPALPATSNNGITGTWSPATISTASIGTTTYTFTPAVGQCATAATTLDVIVSSSLTPTFNAVAPICSGSVAPVLPTTSTNGITGSWSPATVSNTASATYTFTPAAAQCATSTTLSVTVNSSVKPTFTAIAPICSGSVAPVLPTTSTNGITGSWSPATVSNTASATYTFTPAAGQCATSTTLSVTVNSSVTPTFTAIAPICSGSVAPVLPMTSTNGITGSWSPATVSNTASATYTFTPAAGQCATTTTLSITVNSPVTPNFNPVGSLCQNAGAPVLPVTSINGITGSWNPAAINTTSTGTTTYTFTPDAGQCATTTTLDVTVANQVTPVFTAIGPLCQNAVAPALPATSNNGINGTWNPATISTASIGTTTYTFTPAVGQCATAATTLDVIVSSGITPTFNPVGSLCQNAGAPVLPVASINGITGSWNPAAINTTSTGTTTYTFTPDAGQCATTTTLDVTVANQVTPVFTAIGPLCQNVAAPALPATSNNGINGTWSPATISTASIGTTTYTFTPAVGQCATAATTLDVIVSSSITPTFNAVAPICSGSVAPVLPTTSTNGVTGSWSPATVSNTASATYTFTPAAGQCATNTTLSVTVNSSVTPTFNAVAPICSGSVAPVLPATSTNGITGTWSPATVSNTASATYTFTPTAGQCATTTTLGVTVNSSVTPTFTAIAPICSGSVAPVLPTTSTNGVTGSWSPATVSNTASATYTFTPAAGQCATSTTLSVTVNSSVTPTFTAIAPICSGSVAPVLPTTSTNGITGSWSPATVSNTASATYTFTPAAGQCATTTTLSVTVNSPVTPTFNPVGSLCQNAGAPVLPVTSINGITGSWNPAAINTTSTGTTTYTFTPDAGQCATTTTLDVTVANQVTPLFTAIGPLCQNAAAPVLPATSNNGITGTWSPASISTASIGTTTYTFTPSVGQCATATTTLDVIVSSSITPTFNAVAPICSGSVAPVLPTSSTNGITGSWSPATVSNTASATYTFTPAAGQCATTTTLSVTVNSSVTPTFTAIAPICSGSVAPVLPITSTNGITGSWSPATVSNTASATYTFTPAAGQCATTTTLSVTVNSNITPTFNAVVPICSGSVAPVLPTTSTNGITGSWSPATVSNTASATYKFTPAGGQCATTTTLSVTVNSNITPTFNAVAPICSGSVAPVLPTTSTNGVTGSWSPATVSNTASATYTFTPAAGQCATTTTLSVTVNSSVTPTFNAVAPICSGSVAPVLPTTSTNGITGTWSPATVSNTASATYTFTPAGGQCATTTTLSVTVNSNITPTFNAVAPICSGSVAPVLPTTSTNGVTGSWSPATVSNTASATYTFTPAAGQCATTTTLSITVNSPVTPNFNPVGSLCQNAGAPVLPVASINGITGSWNPAAINTTSTGTTTYTFTPDAGQCATTTTLDVTVANQVTPVFTAIGPLCQNAAAPALPATSNNGITGTWSPATISTASIGTTTYTFTPAVGQCATAATTLDVIVSSSITPTFNAVAPICSGSVAPVLPTTSTNGITGSWSPATVSNTASATYTFTPAAGQCATSTTLIVTVNSPVIPTFNPVGSLCQNAGAPVLPVASINGITGSWNPAAINTTSTGTTTYTFTPDAGQCATTTTLDVTVANQVTPVFTAIGPLCQNAAAPALPATSNNGITGTWSPATISTASIGTTTYTFTPAVGQCATAATTLDVIVSSSLTPTFSAVAPICSGSVAPVLPTTSTNGITGSWSPATVSNTASATYTFTPAAGQCATTTTLSITVNSPVTPNFNPVGSLCQNAGAPVLPVTSINGITGSWNPAAINTTSTGTTTYTFTPDAGQCATTTTLDVTVANQVTPVFTAIGPLCQNAAAPALPATSNNGITGTWSPASISTASIGTTTYTFTPSVGQCATAATTLDVIVSSSITPTFNVVAPICSGSVAPVLPPTSTNGITGSWSPATVSNTASATYTFTPAAGQCAGSTTLMVTVYPGLVIPQVSSPVVYCQNAITIALAANATSAGNQLWWYSSATGGTPLSTAPVPLSGNRGITDYYVTQSNATCESPRALVKVIINERPDLGADRDLSICFGTSANLTTLYNTNGYNAVWTFNQVLVASPAAVTVQGVYQLVVRNNFDCNDTARVTANIRPLPVANAGPDDFAEINFPYQLSGSGGKTYQWSPPGPLNDGFIANPVATLNQDATFVLEVQNEFGCIDTDTVNLRVLNGPSIYVPSAFTPNGDGLNDIFRPVVVGVTKMDFFRVYNRYGELVFETRELNKGWDGNYKGLKQSSGNYIWHVKGTDRTGKVRIYKGNMVLIR